MGRDVDEGELGGVLQHTSAGWRVGADRESDSEGRGLRPAREAPHVALCSLTEAFTLPLLYGTLNSFKTTSFFPNSLQ